MVQRGYIYKVGSTLKVLAEKAMGPQQCGGAHATPSPELAPHPSSHCKAGVTGHPYHLYPVRLVMLAGLRVCWVNLPIPATTRDALYNDKGAQQSHTRL